MAGVRWGGLPALCEQQGRRPVPALPSLLGCPSGVALGLQMLEGLGRQGAQRVSGEGTSCTLLLTHSPKGKVSSSDTMKPGQVTAMFPSARLAWVALHWWRLEIPLLCLGAGTVCAWMRLWEKFFGKGWFSPQTSKENKSLQEPFPLVAPLSMQGGLK